MMKRILGLFVVLLMIAFLSVVKLAIRRQAMASLASDGERGQSLH